MGYQLGNRTIYVIEKDDKYLKGLQENSKGLYTFTDNLGDAIHFKSKEDKAPKNSKDDNGKKLKGVRDLSKYLKADIKSFTTQAIYTLRSGMIEHDKDFN